MPDEIVAPVEKGHIIGKVKVYLDGVFFHEENIVSKESIAKLGYLEKMIKKQIINFEISIYEYINFSLRAFFICHQ